MQYSNEVNNMCVVAKGPNHGPAPIPEEGKWIQAKEIKDISGYTHGVGWCAPQQGACKLSLNIKEGIIQECLVETIGCTGMTHSAAMASEILPGKTILEALNTDLVCDAINTATRLFSISPAKMASSSIFCLHSDGITSESTPSSASSVIAPFISVAKGRVELWRAVVLRGSGHTRELSKKGGLHTMRSNFSSMFSSLIYS